MLDPLRQFLSRLFVRVSDLVRRLVFGVRCLRASGEVAPIGTAWNSGGENGTWWTGFLSCGRAIRKDEVLGYAVAHPKDTPAVGQRTLTVRAVQAVLAADDSNPRSGEAYVTLKKPVGQQWVVNWTYRNGLTQF